MSNSFSINMIQQKAIQYLSLFFKKFIKPTNCIPILFISVKLLNEKSQNLLEKFNYIKQG